MKKLHFILLALSALAFGMQSCNNNKTYAEMKEEESDAIERFKSELADSIGATFISEKEFLKDSLTGPNEFVLLEESGVYMNIMSRGEGDVLKKGTYEILTRFLEISLKDDGTVNIHKGDTLCGNLRMASRYPDPEPFQVTIAENSYIGFFTEEAIIMPSLYGSSYSGSGTAAVPGGWLVPLRFLKVSRTTDTDKIARVRLIVPHSQGTSTAMSAVYPCYYEITYNRTR